MTVASLEAEKNTETWRLRALGSWTLEHGLAKVDDRLRKFSEEAEGRELTIDLSELEELDTAGALALQRVMRSCERREAAGSNALSGFQGVAERFNPLLEQAALHLAPCEVEEPVSNSLVRMEIRLREGAKGILMDILELLGFLGAVLTCMFRIIRKPNRFRITSVVHHMEETGLNATLIVGLMSFLIGAVVAFMGIRILRQFGAEIFTVEMIGITVLREFGVLLTAILIAGRSGSAFTASIGSMKLREEIDAMRTIGIDPMEALIIPRTIAMVAVLPVLAFLSSMLGLLGGGLVAWWAADISPSLFMARTQDVIVLQNFFVGMVKAPVFAFFISLVGCYQGMSVEGSAEDLGRRTTMSVVQSLFIVIILDAVFAIIFLELDI